MRHGEEIGEEMEAESPEVRHLEHITDGEDLHALGLLEALRDQVVVDSALLTVQLPGVGVHVLEHVAQPGDRLCFCHPIPHEEQLASLIHSLLVVDIHHVGVGAVAPEADGVWRGLCGHHLARHELGVGRHRLVNAHEGEAGAGGRGVAPICPRQVGSPDPLYQSLGVFLTVNGASNVG